MREAVDECAAAVGYEVEELSAVTDVILPVLRGEVHAHSTFFAMLCLLLSAYRFFSVIFVDYFLFRMPEIPTADDLLVERVV